MPPIAKRADADPVMNIIELRRYRLRPGARETMIAVFEANFIDPQEALGMRVIGPFRDIDDPDSFPWLRGFTSMAARRHALQEFYTGPVWAAGGAAANATMVNSDNVLLLRPARPGSGLSVPEGQAAPGLFTLAIASVAYGTETAFADFFLADVAPRLRAAGADIMAMLQTERSPNDFPRLPVREGESVFVWIAGFADETAHRAHFAKLAATPAWQRDILPALDSRLWQPLEVRRLTPTAQPA